MYKWITSIPIGVGILPDLYVCVYIYIPYYTILSYMHIFIRIRIHPNDIEHHVR